MNKIKKKRQYYLFSPLLINRIKKFIRIKRGFYSLIIILILYILSLLAPFFINSKAFIVKFDNKIYFTFRRESDVKFKKDLTKKLKNARKEYSEYKKLKKDNVNENHLINLKEKIIHYQEIRSAVENHHHRNLQKVLKKQKKGDFALLVLYPHGPYENLPDDLSDYPPTKPELMHFLGTDTNGRDVFAQLVYGFNISMTFALILTFISYLVGVIFGSILGYYGKAIDFFGMRIIEIWSSIPFLYMVMILSSILETNFILLVFLLSLFSWISMTWYIRAEFLREKQKDYVQAAMAIGVNDIVIIFKHILPNSLTPIISFLPFTVIGGISSLVALDFLGFGLSKDTPSWGGLLEQGLENINYWWLVFAPVGALFFTLLIITFIGEAVREAFDPKEYSRLR